MKVSLLTRAVGISAIAVLGLSACGGSSSGGGSTGGGGGSQSISGAGSTFQATMQTQWTSAFGSQSNGAKISYNPVGSSTGIQEFEQGSIDYAGSDVTMESSDQQKADKRCGSTALTFPVTSGGIAIIYNLPNLSQPLKLDAPTIAKIFQGEITKWNDPAIAADNPGVTLPSTTISPVHRADGSGTTDVLSEYLSAEAKGVWKLGADTTLNWPKGAGSAQTGSSGVTQAVSQTQGGITYAESSYVTNGLKAAEVKNAKGQYETLSPTAVAQSISTGFKVTGSGDSLAGTLNFAKMTGYPLSTVSYIIACQKNSKAGLGTTLKNFFDYIVTTGQQGADKLGFAPLPGSLVSQIQKTVNTIS